MQILRAVDCGAERAGVWSARWASLLLFRSSHLGPRPGQVFWPLRHGRWTTLLVDAIAIIGIIRKGQISGKIFSSEVRFAVALCSCGQFADSNPADTPSRYIRCLQCFHASPAPQLAWRATLALQSSFPKWKNISGCCAHWTSQVCDVSLLR